MADISQLERHLAGLGRILLGYSGGVDSALLGVVGARSLGSEGFLAVMGISPSYPESQRQQARSLARRFSIPTLEIETHELDDPRYASNPTNRCYYCKSELWLRLRPLAASRGFDTVIDGTNADDLGGHRPGARAADERGVHSPLAELGWSKSAVRSAARELDIPIWDAPAQPCLASRIRYGLEVTPQKLRQVEDAEEFLRGVGIRGNLRVRHLGDTARIEAEDVGRELLRQRWDEVVSHLEVLGFGQVELDPAGYRRGGLLVLEGAA
jgi:uncharacterized protein